MIWSILPVMSLWSVSPLNSSLLLVMSVLALMPSSATKGPLTLYFICLVFLGGVLAIVTWFSGLAKSSHSNFDSMLLVILLLGVCWASSSSFEPQQSNILEMYLSLPYVSTMIGALVLLLFSASYLMQFQFSLRNM